MSSEIVGDYSEAPDPELYARSVRRVRRGLNAIFGLNVIDPENVPLDGPVILAFSHRTYVDALAVGATAPRAVYGYAKKELNEIPYTPIGHYLYRRGAIFIDRDNFGRDELRAGSAVVQAKKVFGLAPEGTRNKGRTIGETKAGAGYFAVKSEADGVPCPVVPVGVSSERIYRHFRQPLRKMDHPLNVVYGQPLRVDADELGRVPNKILINGFNEQVHDGLQEAFDQALELREVWTPDQSINIPHQW